METTQQTAETPAIVTQFLEFLDKENAREAFEKAYNSGPVFNATGFALVDFLRINTNNPNRFTKLTFSWADTEEGVAFWFRIHCKWLLENGGQL